MEALRETQRTSGSSIRRHERDQSADERSVHTSAEQTQEQKSPDFITILGMNSSIKKRFYFRPVTMLIQLAARGNQVM